MNPDKLFDYLEGRLPSAERIAMEDQLISDQQLQRELAVARRIHAGMHDGSREILLTAQADETRRGRKMALRVGAAFIVLMGVNVAAGLWIIAHHERKNPNRALLEAQTREQIMKSLERAATHGADASAIGCKPGHNFSRTGPTGCRGRRSCRSGWATGRFGYERTSGRASHWRTGRSSIESRIGVSSGDCFSWRGRAGVIRPRLQRRSRGQRPRLQLKRRASLCRSSRNQNDQTDRVAQRYFTKGTKITKSF